MNKIFFLHHLGLGDHLLCNGIYRHFCKHNDLVVLPVKEHNYNTIADMLSDVENVSLLHLEARSADSEMKKASLQFEKMGYHIVKMGYFGKNFLSNKKIRFDKNFYNQVGVDFNCRWDDFHVPRDNIREQKVYDYFNPTSEFVFLHEDSSRGFTINREHIDKKYKIITPIPPSSDNSFRFFDYRKVIEEASEIHCIESSFCAFIEGLDLKNKKFAHRYSRPEASLDFCHEFTYRTDWEIIL